MSHAFYFPKPKPDTSLPMEASPASTFVVSERLLRVTSELLMR
jgi:hypothetical protein